MWNELADKIKDAIAGIFSDQHKREVLAWSLAVVLFFALLVC